MNKAWIVSSGALLAGLGSLPASAMDILARVISSTPVVQQVAVPRQVCSNQAVVTQAPNSGAGALLGALAGGALGNSIGNGGGRAAATVIGAFGGAIVGDRMEGANRQIQNQQQCTTQIFYENQPSYYNVVYEYSGAQYTAQMANNPGAYLRLQVTPVGAITATSQSMLPAPPQTYVQQTPVYVQQAPVYVQSVATAPVYYTRPYYAPYYSPIGVSLNYGYSRGYGGYHHHQHWR